MAASVDPPAESPPQQDDTSGFSPTRRPRISLGLRLSLPANLVIMAAMAALTGAQLVADLRIEASSRLAHFSEALAPLVVDIEAQPSVIGTTETLARFHQAFLRQGRSRHLLAVIDAEGRSLAAAGDRTVLDEEAALAVRLPLSSSAFGHEPAVLLAADVDPAVAAERSRRWRAWALHLAVTAAMLQLLLYVVMQRQIAAPIERLVAGVRKMQMGYWSDLADPGGAWELRWLGSRFRAFGQDLGSNVEHFVAAQRRAFAHAMAGLTDADAESEPPPAPDGPRAVESNPLLMQLEHAAARLQHGRADDPSIHALARSAWDSLAAQAEELGYPELRCELEDAALRILDPADWRQIASRVQAERPRLEALALACSHRLQEAVELHGVACVAVQRRVKHSAGVWRKMQHKDLELHQVHDLVAVRIIVATEADCYLALRAIQEVCSPIIGRFKDYIAAPKHNGYRSLHLSVRDRDGEVFEIQIRSVAMHRHAEQGAAAHALYKDEQVVEPARARLLPLWRAVRAAIRPWAQRGRARNSS